MRCMRCSLGSARPKLWLCGRCLIAVHILREDIAEFLNPTGTDDFLTNPPLFWRMADHDDDWRARAVERGTRLRRMSYHEKHM